ncbi:glycosyltransferase [Paracoccus subflavus]|uniref:Glycosyltransferase n=1 Tax=Paracoccus subflavus TaxID=2528244 RepID=A0A4Q9G4N3_9RHOB|nr:glycosyltransferase family 2 protein [Paracoccus subflavus]TBN43664.1 glycosyltransferase [Paracoccus subflavus]
MKHYPAKLQPSGITAQLHQIPDLSFVVPAFNEQDNIAETIDRIATEALRLGCLFEIIVVDDGSTDATFPVAKAQADRLPVRILRLSRNFGKEHAIMAGLEKAAGAAVVILDADLQEPLAHLETMLAHRAEGFDVVYATRARRDDESWRKRAFTRLFYALLNLGGDVEIPPDARDFRLMDRRVVDALCALPERNRFMKGLYGWVGFRSKAIPIHLEPRRAGTSKFGFHKLFRLGVTGLTSFTAWPLRVWTSIGMLVAAGSILYGLWIIARTILFGTEVPGWSTLVVAISLLGGVQLISIGVLGEYLARVFTEVKGRPGFIIAEDYSANPRQT